MKKIKHLILYLFTQPSVVFAYICRKLSPILPAKLFLLLMHRIKFGYWMNFNDPQTYSEKLQWQKLYDRRPDYVTMVDKYEAKTYVANIIGEEYIIPTIGVWNDPEEIDWDALPMQFVLKCTHDSGGLVICKDKSKLDIRAAKKKLQRSLKTNYYNIAKEWPYKCVPRRIIAEQYMEDTETKELRDYKFFCFNGVPKALFIATDRQNRKEPYFDFFDMEFNHLDIRHGHPNAPVLPEKPQNFELMKELAAKLSKGYPQLRVDLYEVNGKVYFGELTLFHHSALVRFEPQKWDEIFGSWIDLSFARK